MEGSMAGAGAWYVKVMTDEQMEQLRRQIAAYAIISEQLAEMHRATMARQDSLSGMRPSSLNSDPVMTSGGVKISARQRWAPTHMQVEILESIFQEGFRNPTKQRIKEITSDLSQHGQISESNVYNWFQNRRARRKRKKTTSEVEAESLNEKEVKTERTVADNCNLSPTVDHSFRSPDIISELLFFDPDPNGGHDMYALHDNWKFSGAYDEEMPAYGNSLSTPKKQH